MTIREEEELEERCRKLASRLGCGLELWWASTFMVVGPHDVYGCDSCRVDPCEGDNAARNWTEVLARLLRYRDDMHFHSFGVDSASTELLLRVPDPHGLRAAWVDFPEDDLSRLAFCDHLEEIGLPKSSLFLRNFSHVT